jgi:hypothetical protein
MSNQHQHNSDESVPEVTQRDDLFVQAESKQSHNDVLTLTCATSSCDYVIHREREQLRISRRNEVR